VSNALIWSICGELRNSATGNIS